MLRIKGLNGRSGHRENPPVCCTEVDRIAARPRLFSMALVLPTRIML
jgi:hypothetical protein